MCFGYNWIIILYCIGDGWLNYLFCLFYLELFDLIGVVNEFLYSCRFNC